VARADLDLLRSVSRAIEGEAASPAP